MKEGWERAGRPAAGWMAPSFFAIALVHGLRGNDEAYEEFWHLAMKIRLRRTVNSFSLFVEPRVALHIGEYERALATAAVDDQDMCGSFGPYARAISVEVAVVTGAEMLKNGWRRRNSSAERTISSPPPLLPCRWPSPPRPGCVEEIGERVGGHWGAF